MVVRMRANRAHRNNRRSHFALVAARVSRCADCGAERQSHRVCAVCGKYKGRVVIDVVAKVTKREKKEKDGVKK